MKAYTLCIAAALIARLAVIGGRHELCADLVGELVFFDVCSLDCEALERRMFCVNLTAASIP